VSINPLPVVFISGVIVCLRKFQNLKMARGLSYLP